jgi:hypothetical protein
MPNPIGAVHYTFPRAVMARDPQDLSSSHSAVSGQLIIYTDTKLQADSVINRWDEIMQGVNDKIMEIFTNIENSDTG